MQLIFFHMSSQSTMILIEIYKVIGFPYFEVVYIDFIKIKVVYLKSIFPTDVQSYTYI